MAPGNHAGIEPVRRLKVSDSVAAQLEQLITGGEYQTGDKLPPERVLAEQFGVGRSSMREALRLVEANGLVRTEHGVGVFVVGTSKRLPGLSELLFVDDFTVPELFEVRLPLEREAAGLAARRITPADVAELERIIAAAADPGLSDEQFIALDAELHRTIAKASHNRLLVKLIGSIEPFFFSYSHRVIGLPGRRVVAHAGHCKIVDAIVGKRVRDAQNAAVSHIREVEQDIVKHLEQARGDA
ncbi:MAG TPA: FadR/GntR family transcriptional regulator [Mycobacteriales bacterium]|jgi:GntR family transcriptional repressor for pyruvate dehydrogenase complex|nr:FadR/GntR family transcriptional regulator [Mycobacteriales bacterium]